VTCVVQFALGGHSFQQPRAGVHHLIETKGREDIDVRHKDRSASLWCENATLLTGTEWVYRKVLQKEFERLQPIDFEDLIALDPILPM